MEIIIYLKVILFSVTHVQHIIIYLFPFYILTDIEFHFYIRQNCVHTFKTRAIHTAHSHYGDFFQYYSRV